jgi:hypothetical protein
VPIGNDIMSMLSGTAMKAMRDSCSSKVDKRRRFSETRVNRARNWPRPVIHRQRQPSARNAASKSSGSLNTNVALPGILAL